MMFWEYTFTVIFQNYSKLELYNNIVVIPSKPFPRTAYNIIYNIMFSRVYDFEKPDPEITGMFYIRKT